MKGERKMLERLLQTEIAMLRAIRDGSALMQHDETAHCVTRNLQLGSWNYSLF
jgi:hypothetical protein